LEGGAKGFFCDKVYNNNMNKASLFFYGDEWKPAGGKHVEGICRVVGSGWFAYYNFRDGAGEDEKFTVSTVTTLSAQSFGVNLPDEYYF
jgi:hypothetical protein